MTGVRKDVTPLPDLLHGRASAGPVRERRPVYVDGLPLATADARQGRTSRPGWPASPRGGPKRPGESWSKTTRCPPSTGACATTRARASATELTSTARYRSIRLNDSSATWPLSRAGDSMRHRRRAASGCSSSEPGRADCQLPTIWPVVDMMSRSGIRVPSPGE
jgi:hypothetical protein